MVQAKKSALPRGLFITFEGIDGSGKTLQAEILSNNLRERGHAATLVRDPGSTAISEQIRGILLDRRHLNMHSVTELFLYAAARSQLVSEIIRPALDRGEIALSDRFTDSTLAYQGYGRSIPLTLIQETNRRACGDIFPHRTFILDIPWEESLHRRLKLPKESDRMEAEKVKFYRRVRDAYRTLSRQEPDRIRFLDGTKPVKTLEQEILQDVLLLIDRL